MANVIYRGPIAREPQTLNLPVAGAYLPGIFVTEDGDELTQAADGTGRLLLLSNRRFYGQDIATAYESGETGVAYRVEPDQEYQARFDADTYAHGAALTVSSDGRMAAATTGDVIVAYYDGEGATLDAGDFDDVVIASNAHVSA